jgi:hypothetical protein
MRAGFVAVLILRDPNPISFQEEPVSQSRDAEVILYGPFFNPFLTIWARVVNLRKKSIA